MSEESPATNDLRDSTERLRAILDTAIEAIITIDERGRIESANPATERLFGFHAAEMIGQNVSMLMPSPDRERHDTYLSNYLRTGEAKIIGIGREVMCWRRDGTLFPAELSVSEMQLAGRRSFTGILRDISERKLGEEALRASERDLERALGFHRAIMANMAEGLYTVDAQGLVTYVNPAAERLFGWSSAELLGRKMHDVIHYQHPDGSPFPACECAGLQVLALGIPLVNFEDIFIRKDGSFFPVVYSSSPLETDGRISGLVVVFRDVTADQQARAAVKESRARLAGIVGSAMDAIVSVDSGQRIILFNAAAEKMFRCAASEAIGCSIERFIPNRFRAAHAGHIRRFGRRA